ncbi:hypothetical protein V8G54_005086 [Vigna mungo]|uniref:Uncharacterized protein n=1 Tax=Vigna mungo TaxID=3915 RepID=A0AAQ3PJC5_VIGMU
MLFHISCLLFCFFLVLCTFLLHFLFQWCEHILLGVFLCALRFVLLACEVFAFLFLSGVLVFLGFGSEVFFYRFAIPWSRFDRNVSCSAKPLIVGSSFVAGSFDTPSFMCNLCNEHHLF